MNLAFVHGWGFDSSLWAELAGRFSGFALLERGYFGGGGDPVPGDEFVAVTHSFGTMRLLAEMPPSCRGLIAINGFDRFAETVGFPGVPRRVIDRMIARFGETPQEGLSDFRQRCGCDAPFGTPDADLLLGDLVMLRDGDCRVEAARCGLPILSLQAGQDPIVPAAMRNAVFASAACCERVTLEGGGHLLPVEEPGTCADAISAFMERLT